MKKDESDESTDTPASEVPIPFMRVEKQLFRNLKRAHDSLHVEQYKFFKNHDITIAQFDLMETILLSPSQALSIQQLAINTVSLQPNITRSVGTLEKAGLVSCARNKIDNRMVMVKLTRKGEQLIAQIQQPLLELHLSQFKNFEVDELNLLNDLVKKIYCVQDSSGK